MENIEKIKSLYRYIKDLYTTRSKIVADYKDQSWYFVLSELPDLPDYIKAYDRDRIKEEGDDSENDAVLLEVLKPEFTACPKPSALLMRHLEFGWENYKNSALLSDLYRTDHLAAQTQDGTENIRRSKEQEELVALFREWNKQREEWVAKQRDIHVGVTLFNQMYAAYVDLERDSETIEFMVGNGVIQDRSNSVIRHPVLLKRVKFEFDSRANIMKILDTDSEPELYTTLIKEMEAINHSAISEIAGELKENSYHPLDRIETTEFMKSLTHRISSDSKFIFDPDNPGTIRERIRVTFQPVFFIRKRIDGTIRTIEDIIKNIEATNHVPNHLINLVGQATPSEPTEIRNLSIDEQLAAISGENAQILLSKEANHEQLEIAERIEHHHAVLVQGPPGTGKTHTIANLMGHFLAQGKSVLVTSHTKKALSVLKSQIPEEIQDLCVSVLDDTSKDMMRSIEGITERLGRYSAHELKKQSSALDDERQKILIDLGEIRRKIYAIRNREFESVTYNGRNYSPIQMASFVKDNENELSYIPGQVRLNQPLPVSVQDLQLLYESNALISTQDQREMVNNLPDPATLVKPSELGDLINEERRVFQTFEEIASIWGCTIKPDTSNGRVYAVHEGKQVDLIHKPEAQSLKKLKQTLSTYPELSPWMIHAAVDGRRGGAYRQRWVYLIDKLSDAIQLQDSLIMPMLGKITEIKSSEPIGDFKVSLEKTKDLFHRKGRVGKLDLLLNKDLKMVLDTFFIDDLPVSSEDDCQLFLSKIKLNSLLTECRTLWDELLAKHAFVRFDELGDEPLNMAPKMISTVRRYLDWYEAEYGEIQVLFATSGLQEKALIQADELDSDYQQAEKILAAIKDKVPRLIQVAEGLIKLIEIENMISVSSAELKAGNRNNSVLCIQMMTALYEKDQSNYESNYLMLVELYRKYGTQRKRQEVLCSIEPYSPEWAGSIRNRIGIHGQSQIPPKIEMAWQWKQFSGILTELLSEPYEELQRKSVELSKLLRKKTAELAASKSWYHLIDRVDSSLEMKQSLMGWKLTQKKIGKGTGKNAGRLKKQARDNMTKCQRAVPAWIMPMSRATETLEPGKNEFDILIIDEASQSDISALAIMYMAAKVIIVGDDKQVSPMAIGMDVDKMNSLREMNLTNGIPNAHLYDGKTSLYDIAMTTYQPLMLREHFRCVPEIIGYSNKLSYDFKIKPLRDGSRNITIPPVVKYQVANGAREGRRKINPKEALTIVALMKAAMEQKEYAGKTFGAISLLGDDQVKLIQQNLFRYFEPRVLEERRVLCGNASHFQGDERDIIFISLVDSNEGEGPLRLTGEGVDQSTKQRYNVAASRARDQLWIVNSLDYARDLKMGDLRRDLLEYAEDPEAYAQKALEIDHNSESPFEAAVAKTLLAKGYHLTQQWKVGAYRIDMVIEYGGKRIALECDGEQYHTGSGKVRQDMERQTILERMGWRFIRIRGSEYYLDPTKCMERVFRELEAAGIYQESPIHLQTDGQEGDLLKRVKLRAAEIINEWEKSPTDSNESAFTI